MFWIWFCILLVVNFVLYTVSKCPVKCPIPDRQYLRPCLKKPAEEPKLGQPTFLDSVKGFAKTVKKTFLKVTGKAKRVKIEAAPTNCLVVFRWIDKEKDCFHRVKKRRQVPKRC
ncbi:hypothetical protein MMC31_001439 [Peltigera leucophlebia]|nr:hypothetical protein [Peltigera leucophlebia]